MTTAAAVYSRTRLDYIETGSDPPALPAPPTMPPMMKRTMTFSKFQLFDEIKTVKKKMKVMHYVMITHGYTCPLASTSTGQMNCKILSGLRAGDICAVFAEEGQWFGGYRVMDPENKGWFSGHFSQRLPDRRSEITAHHRHKYASAAHGYTKDGHSALLPPPIPGHEHETTSPVPHHVFHAQTGTPDHTESEEEEHEGPPPVPHHVHTHGSLDVDETESEEDDDGTEHGPPPPMPDHLRQDSPLVPSSSEDDESYHEEAPPMPAHLHEDSDGTSDEDEAPPDHSHLAEAKSLLAEG